MTQLCIALMNWTAGELRVDQSSNLSSKSLEIMRWVNSQVPKIINLVIRLLSDYKMRDHVVELQLNSVDFTKPSI